MTILDLRPEALRELSERFGNRLRSDVAMSRFTAARLGGPADALLEVLTSEELVEATAICWQAGYPFRILGAGSNVLVSDSGVRALIMINRTRRIRFEDQEEPPQVWAESGVNFGLLARQAAEKGLSGLEWASGIPGTIGGAVVGNAGAHGCDMACNLRLAEILHQVGVGRVIKARREDWSLEKLDFTYRSSALKRQPGSAVVLSVSLTLQHSSPESVQAKIDELVAYRRRTQPPGASMGSMFKNPPGDFAGRLIDSAGLKGYRQGNAVISPLHANFFINQGHASAQDVYRLIQHARQTVAEKSGIWLELEIELLGEW